MLSNIFLIGLMGAGKTTLGLALAKKLAFPFWDSDREIEKRTGVTIAHIFEHEQEAGFRRRESRMIDELTQRPGIVLATGGGAVLQPENREWLTSRGTVIYLHATPDQLWERVKRNKTRPLLHTEDPYATLSALYAVRDPLYRACAHWVLPQGEGISDKKQKGVAEHVNAIVDFIEGTL